LHALFQDVLLVFHPSGYFGHVHDRLSVKKTMHWRLAWTVHLQASRRIAMVRRD
jgi:hypothetical protein